MNTTDPAGGPEAMAARAMPCARSPLTPRAIPVLPAGARRLRDWCDGDALAAEEAVRASGADWTIIRVSWFSRNFSEGDFLDDIRAGGRTLTFEPVPMSRWVADLADRGVPDDDVNLLRYLFEEALDGRDESLTDGSSVGRAVLPPTSPPTRGALPRAGCGPRERRGRARDADDRRRARLMTMERNARVQASGTSDRGTSLNSPLVLPCGARLSNRLAKAAMSEQLATRRNEPTPRLTDLYGRWGASGAGLLITGNVMVDRRAVSEPRQAAVEEGYHAAFEAWAAAATHGGAHAWV
jgi:hypothetical protein